MDDAIDLKKASLVVITLNEQDNIGDCLSSAEGVGEVVVVDSFSADDTVKIAKGMGARVYEREFVSNADQKNWAMDKATGEWILILDADESLSPELREEISRELESPRFEGYRIRRRNRFMGRWIKYCGWQRDSVIRLFRSGAGSYAERAVHEKLRLKGSEGSLKSPILHVPYRDFSDYIERMKAYSRRGAQILFEERRSWFPGVFTRPFARFLRMFILQLGFMDGMPGFVLCATASISVFFKYLYLIELHRGRGAK